MEINSGDDLSDVSTERPQPMVRSVTFDESPTNPGISSVKPPSGLGRIRSNITRQNSHDERMSGTTTPSLMLQPNISSTHLEDLEAFPTTSLHSFSFAVQHDTIAARHNIVQRSIDYLRERLTGGHRAVTFTQDSTTVMDEVVESPPPPPPSTTTNRKELKLDLQGVNDNAFDPSRRPLMTAPPAQTGFDSDVPSFAIGSEQSSRQSSRGVSPHFGSRSTTTTSGTSNQSLIPPRGRAISFSDKYPDLRRQLQSSLSCTNLPNLTTHYQTSPLQPVHPTNRWNQQSTQAVFTTSLEDPWSIQTANDYAMMIFGLGRDAIRKKSLVDYVVEDRRAWLRERLRESRKHKPTEGQVLLCGDVLPVIKRLGNGAASLWIKEKTNGLVWVIEEIEEGVCMLSLDGLDTTITAAHGDAAKVFDRDVIEASLDTAVGSLPRLPSGLLDLEEITRISNYTLKSATGDIPCTIEPSIFSTEARHSLRVSFLPHVAGILVLSADTMTVKSANPVFTSSLFGQRNTTGIHISTLLPDFEQLLENLEAENGEGFREGQVIPELAFRDSAKNVYGLSPEAALRGIKSRHRNGATVYVDIQMRISSSPQVAGNVESRSSKFSLATSSRDDRLYALWISYEKGLTSKAQDQVVHTAVSQAKQAVAPSNTSTQPSSPVDTLDNDEALSNSTGDMVPRTIKDYQIIEEMGAGAYGQVKLARYGRKRQRVVLKYVTKSRILVDTWTRDRKLGTVPLEIHVLNHLKSHQHANLVEMKDFFEDDQNYYIVMSAHVPGMDLFDYIELNTSMTEWECKCISLQVAKALAHLHSLDIVHRDIKDENVVLDRNGWVKLIDFGSANYCRNGPFDTFHGTLDYASPEALDGKPYMGKEQDVWACGILFYTLIYKENPFYNIDEIMDRDLRVPYVVSDKSIDLIRRMLNRNVPERLTMDAVVQHDWYEDCAGDPRETVKIDIPQR